LATQWPGCFAKIGQRLGRLGQLKRPLKEDKNKEEEEENSSNDW
jgi:hypothetical protein